MHNSESGEIMALFDVTRAIFSNMTVWPGDDNVILERVSKISEGKSANVSRLHTGVHAGTHIDAPLHFIDGGKSVDQLDIRLFSGRAQVIDARDVDKIGREFLLQYSIRKDEAVFLKTEYSERSLREPFYTGYTALTSDGAQYLLDLGVKVVGTDALSVECFGDKVHPVHKLLLGNEVLIIEGLCLKDIKAGVYRYVCLPILVQGSDGAPARVLLNDDTNLIDKESFFW